MSPLVALAALAALQDPRGEPELVGGVPYEPRETREATRRHVVQAIDPVVGTFGDWFLASPFPYSGHGTGGLAEVHPPEEELAAMAANGPGPDLARTFAGKNGVEVRWQPIEGGVENRMVELNVHEDDELDDQASCYLYGTIHAGADAVMPIDFGSDDGVAFWLNGELLLENDTERGLDPFAEHLDLPLVAGTNHVLVEVTEGVGGWAFHVQTRQPLPGDVDAKLQYLLDRDFPPSPDRRHWEVVTVPVPDGVVLEVGGLGFLSDGRPVVCTRRGDVFVVEGAGAMPPLGASFHRFASGLHEPLGLAVRRENGRDVVYCVQRGELTRLVDTDGDLVADLYETVCDDWGVSGNYHEFAFGPEFDEDGNAWVALNLGFCGSLGKSTARWRGWALKVTPEGEAVPVCDGLRSPNGLGAWTDGAMFYVDNQGDYVATNRLAHLAEGSWHGHPASLRWRDDLASPDDRPPRHPTAVWFPYKDMGQSAADVALDATRGRFGPFAGQLFVGDQTVCSVMRVALEKVNGVYQGACFPFLEGLDCGVNRIAFAPDGTMFVGETDRGWGSTGRRPYGLQAVRFTGVEPFEMRAVRARRDGFEIEYTQAVDPETAADPASYAAESWTYEYHADYGAPETDELELEVVSAELVDRRRVHLTIEPLRLGHVHEIRAEGVRAAATGEPLLHPVAYYTLQTAPGREGVGRPDDAALPKVLFLTHSAGFEHEVVKRPRPHVLSHAEDRFLEAARGRFDATASQDCGRVTAESLAGLDAVVFYTTGELPVPEGGARALVDWVRGGGAFVGVHSATDTFHEVPAYHAMLGGTFGGHPWNEEVAAVVTAPSHPAVSGLPERFAITDEIYQHLDFRAPPSRPLVALDPASVEIALGGRADGEYALAWSRDFGEGRVLYTALGHRPEVWRDERFLEHLLDGIAWAVEGPDWPVPAPEGALVLFDGRDLSGWRHRNGRDAGWRVDEGFFEVAPGAGDLVSRATFGDAWIHVEFQTPVLPDDVEGQARGNSGVYVHGRYEVQVLDSHGLARLGTGDCGAIYSQHAPLANASRPPARWQTYDVELSAPRFDDLLAKTASARMTVWHNGVLIHDDVELPGPTGGAVASGEVAEGPLMLQDHGDRVRYRNVWVLPR